MDKSVKWQDSSQPSEIDASDSPTLSDKRPVSGLKRKKSNIFTKIRKSILGITSSSQNDEDNTDNGDKRGLKRALSMDAGLQSRISQLASSVPSEKLDENQQNFQRIPRKTRLRRSKSLFSSINDSIEPAPTAPGIGSILQSPKTVDASTNEVSDSIPEACESFNIPKTASLLNTIETNHINLTHQVFNCSWLAPTRKSQLFPGTLALLPQSSTILFNCQHFNRAIRIKFLFSDILNIARGSWNDKRNQALIIDLIRGKRKTWVFVAWTDDHFQQALDCLVHAWKVDCLNKIKSGLDQRKAHLNMKYCHIIKDADKANEATKIQGDSGLLVGLVDNFIQLFTTSDSLNDEGNHLYVQLKKKKELNYDLKNVLFESDISFVTPQLLASILTEQSTNFMTNFHALHGIVITNDSGWNRKTNSRNFVSFVTKEESKMKILKWQVKQHLLINESELVVLETLLQLSENRFFKIYHEIKLNREVLDKFTADYSCHIKVTGALDSSDSLQVNAEEEICSYFRENYFPSLFHLLEALINESQSEFETEATEEAKILLPPHYRFVKESIRVRALKINLYFTTAILPFLYKLLHFKEFKYLRYLFLSFIFIYLLRILLDYIKTIRNKPIDVEGQFNALLKELTADAIESGSPIHSLKLKYQQQE